MKKTDLNQYNPTLTHKFMKMVEEKGLLDLIFTQNIDALEIKAGISEENVVFFHGEANRASCAACRKERDMEEVRKAIEEENVLHCDECNGPIKPNLVLYGETINEENLKKTPRIKDAEVVFIIGTTLKVMPFNVLAYSTNPNCSRIVINMERVGIEGPSGINYDSELSNDLFLGGKCDEIVEKLIEDLEWN